jgi:Tol biopolymer transport system component
MRVPAALALLVLALPAAAFHLQTPPIVQLTSTTTESMLPRVPAAGRRLALAIEGSGRQIFRQDRRGNTLEQITFAGDNDNPTISSRGKIIAWQADCEIIGCDAPGQQIFIWNGRRLWDGHGIAQVTNDPTGTSANPALSGGGSLLAFESTGDLAGTPNGGARQVFLIGNDGEIQQVSHGDGDSGNVTITKGGVTLAYDSTSSVSGTDTGVAQIWLMERRSPAAPITAGEGDSRRPAISGEGRYLVFESTADLLGDQHDTGVSQIFAYSLRHALLSRITDDPGGCTGASVTRVPGDWRVGFSCHGSGFFHHLIEGQTYRLPIVGGDTPQAVAELGGHFMVVSTTANLLGGGTTPVHQVYMLNLHKLAAIPVDTTVDP